MYISAIIYLIIGSYALISDIYFWIIYKKYKKRFLEYYNILLDNKPSFNESYLSKFKDLDLNKIRSINGTFFKDAENDRYKKLYHKYYNICKEIEDNFAELEYFKLKNREKSFKELGI